MFPPWYDLLEGMCLAILCLVPLARIWPAVDCRSRAAAFLSRLWRHPRSGQVCSAVLGTSILFVVAEGVLGGPDELLPRLDLIARDVALVGASHPIVRQAAVAVTDVMGPGLVAATVSAGLCIFVIGSRRDALVFALGTTSAWVLSGSLKVAFAAPRPRAVAGYGFPSAHVFVTVVVCGLLAWILAPYVTPAMRRVLYGGAACAAVATGMARMIMDAHWLSDVMGGLAIGTVWVSMVILLVSRERTARSSLAVRRERRREPSRGIG